MFQVWIFGDDCLVFDPRQQYTLTCANLRVNVLMLSHITFSFFVYNLVGVFEIKEGGSRQTDYKKDTISIRYDCPPNTGRPTHCTGRRYSGGKEEPND